MNRRYLASVCVATATALAPSIARADLSDVLGATHIAGQYYFGTQDYLSQGADQVLASGSKVIKLELGASYKTKYPWNTPTWGTVNSLTDLAKTNYFASVFA